jgi:alkanesulfonate monooxygenase SsuD/methylene tetrahydromethanopterin reductase-like flavin-dependent oxidoreductase (luciferase family)
MGPKAIARAARWADGIYGTSMAGDREGHERIFQMAQAAWPEAGRVEKPYLIGGFWYSLAPDAEHELTDYVFNYLRYAGEEPARAIASTMTRHTPNAILEAIENVRAAGADECILVPATTYVDEFERLAKLLG